MIKVFLSSATIDTDAIDIIHLISNISSNLNAGKNISFNDRFQSVWKKTNELNSHLYVVDTYHLKDFLSAVNLSTTFFEIQKNLKRIDFLYKTCEKWSRTYNKQRKTLPLVEFTDYMISLKDNYPIQLKNKLYEILFSNKKILSFNFLDKFCELLSSNDWTEYDLKISPQHQLFSLYNHIIYSEIQSLTTLIFSYFWKSQSTDIDYTNLKIRRINTTVQRITEYTKIFKYKISTTLNYIRPRDATKYQGKTYAAFDGLYYAFVVNQKKIEYNDAYCQDDCKSIPDKQIMFQSDKSRYHHICPGWIFDCEGDGSYDVCPTDENLSISKHYHWFKNIDNGVFYGDKNHTCVATEKIISISGFIGSQTCNACLCRCVDNHIHTDNKKIRAFSFLWSQTGIDMVATGVRLVAKDKMIHIQLREAKLLPHGKINKTTERWVPLPEFEYDNYFPSVAIYPNGKRYPLIQDKDFGSVQRIFSDKICLQKFNFGEKYLLNAIRFNIMYFNEKKNNTERCFNLDVNYVEFNYENGNITTEKTFKKQKINLTELILNEPDDPLKFKNNIHDSTENQFIKIGMSDLIKDASQTTIPFIDLLNVTTYPSVPLSGIELFHKGQLDRTSGGYISLKVFPLNLTMYINDL